MKTRLVIYAEDAMVLTDGKIYGKQICLAEGTTADAFYEITDDEYAKILEAQLREGEV